MGLGSTAKKVQKLADVAEEMYKRVTELREQINALRETVEETSDRVETLEADVAAQRALLDAIAEQHDVDPERVVAAAETGEEESTGVPSTNAPPTDT